MLGKFLDPLADKLIVNAVLVYMVALGRVPAWVVVVLIGRDLAVNGLRSIASAQGLVIAASDGGKIKTALQLVAIMLLLIHFRYPALGVGIPVDYHVAGLVAAVRVDGGIAVFRRASTCATSWRRRSSSRARRRDRGTRCAAASGRSRAPGRGAAGGVLAVGAGGRRGRHRARSGRRGARARRARRRAGGSGARRAGVGGGARGVGARRARRRRAGVPAAVGWFSYDLGRAFIGLPARAGDAVPALAAGRVSLSTTPSGCATRAAPRRSSRTTRRRRRRLAALLARPAPAAPRRSAWARSPPIIPDERGFSRRRARARIPAGGRRLPGEPVAPPVGDVHAGGGPRRSRWRRRCARAHRRRTRR